MKTVLFVLFILVGTSKIYSQDTIHFLDNTIKIVKVSEINVDDVKYHRFDNLDGPVYVSNKNEIERIFEMKFSDKFNIHRTRQGFANNGIDTFGNMAHKGMMVIDRVVEEEMQGETDLKTNEWIIPLIER